MKKEWKIKKIGVVCSLMTGGTPSKTKPEYFGGEIRWLVSGDIHQREIFDCEGRITVEGMRNSNAKLLPVNSVMIALNGQGKTRGTVALLRTPATCNQSLVSIFPKDSEKLLPEYLFSNLHGRYQEIRQMTGDSGNDRRGLNMEIIRNIEIPLPTLPIQQRIVAILDEAFSAIDKARENVERNLQNARELFESYLQSIFANPGEEWEHKRLGDICEIERGGSPRPIKSYLTDSPNGINWIKISDTQGITKYIYQTKEKIKPEGAKRSRIVNEGDFILSNSMSFGRPYIMKTTGCIHDGWLVLREKENNIDKDFLYYVLGSDFAYSQFDNLAAGSTVRNLNIDLVRKVRINIPPLSEQKAIISKLDALSDETRKLEAMYRKKLDNLEELKKTILQKAFNGELTD